MRTNPLVSVIIPTFDRKLFLEEAVSSCLTQTWNNVEVIIVDDGSTDGTRAFVASQLRGNWGGRRIYYCEQENAGASVARNLGLSLSSGKYIQFLDSDDVLFVEKLSLQVSELEHPDNPLAEACACYGQIGNPPPDSARNLRIGVCCRTPREFVEALCGRIVHGMQTSAPLWRRSFLTNRPAWRTDINLGDDLEFHIRLLVQAKETKFVQQELFLVRDHQGPRLSDNIANYASTLSAIRARMAIFETLQSSGFWDAGTQMKFLQAMRPIYANLLACGTTADICRVEKWLLQCSTNPARRLFFPSVIALRRAVGRHSVLTAHKCLVQLR